MIRVIIERKVKKGKESEYLELVSKLRSKAIRQPGYVHGETWVVDNDLSHFIIISTWIGAELWQVWESSTERQSLIANVEPLLAAPAETKMLRLSGEIEVDWNYRSQPKVK